MTAPASPLVAVPVRVLVADDAAELRRLVCDAFGRRPELVVVGEATHAQEIFDKAESLQPDVVLLDYFLPGADADALVCGVQARAADAAIVGFSGYDPEILQPHARRLLARHVDKMCALADLATAVAAAGAEHSGSARLRNGSVSRRSAVRTSSALRPSAEAP